MWWGEGGAGGEVGGGTGIGMQKQNNKLINNKKKPQVKSPV